MLRLMFSTVYFLLLLIKSLSVLMQILSLTISIIIDSVARNENEVKKKFKKMRMNQINLNNSSHLSTDGLI